MSLAAGHTPLLERLRPHPHRGDVIAAGVVPLALAAFVIELRMTQWAIGARFLVVAVIAGLLLLMAWLAPLEDLTPRPYHSLLLVAGLLVLVLALGLLPRVLGSDRLSSGAVFWTLGLEAVAAAVLARRFGSGICTLIAALAGAISVEAFVAWVFAPHGASTFKAILVLLTLGFVVGAMMWHDRRRRRAVALVNAAGVLTIVLALLLVFTTIASYVSSRVSGVSSSGLALASSASFGWKLYLLVIGFGLIAYAAVDREPGPAYLGVLVLSSFAGLVSGSLSGRGSLLFWPLFLLVLGVGAIAFGLRPRSPLPPPPATGPPGDAVAMTPVTEPRVAPDA